MPYFSIITVNLNNLRGLQRTLQSVVQQTFSNFEFIIIDGGSTDGSKEYLEEFSQNVDYWVSEKDNGIFNAMNKGIENAKGDYIIFLNSGDYFHQFTVLEKVSKENHDADILYGDVIWYPRKFNGSYPNRLNFSHFRTNTIPHQGSFIKRRLFDLVGRYDEQFRVNSDWIFFVLAIFKFNCSYQHVGHIISVCDTGGVSLTEAGVTETRKIREEFLRRNFKHFYNDYLMKINDSEEVLYYRNLMSQRIMKFAFYINKRYHRIRKILKSK